MKELKEKRPFKLVNENDHCDPLYEYRIKGGGQLFKFTMHSIPEEHRDWLGMVITRIINDAYDAGQRDVQHAVKRQLNELFGILNIEVNL